MGHDVSPARQVQGTPVCWAALTRCHSGLLLSPLLDQLSGISAWRTVKTKQVTPCSQIGCCTDTVHCEQELLRPACGRRGGLGRDPSPTPKAAVLRFSHRLCPWVPHLWQGQQVCGADEEVAMEVGDPEALAAANAHDALPRCRQTPGHVLALKPHVGPLRLKAYPSELKAQCGA